MYFQMDVPLFVVFVVADYGTADYQQCALEHAEENLSHLVF